MSEFDLSEVTFKDPPKDLDAERNLLGALMQDGSLLETISNTVGSLTVNDFASEKNRIIYAAILKRNATTDDFNPTSLSAQLENDGTLVKAGGRGYMASLIIASGAPSSAVIEFAQIIRNKSKRRSMIAACDIITHMCYQPEGKTAREIYDTASGLIFKLVEASAKNDVGPQPAVPKAVELIAKIHEELQREQAMSGVPTGFVELDELTQGLQPGSLNIIAARPSVGKTSFAMNIVANIAMNPNVHKPALVFSLEMPTEQILMRLLSTFGRVSMNKLKAGDVENRNWLDIVRKIKLLIDKSDGNEHDKLFIDDSGDITPLELRARARKLALERGGLSVIMIDYIQLMRSQTKAANRTLEIGEISRSLKMLAKELEVPIIALAQLNREVDNRKDHRPLNSDLRESGSLEQDADMIMFLHREAIYHRTEGAEDNSNQATLIIGKNRNGAIADIDLHFVGEYTAFFDKGYAEANYDYLHQTSSSQSSHQAQAQTQAQSQNYNHQMGVPAQATPY